MTFWDEFFWAVKAGYDDLRAKHDKWAVLLFALLALVLYWIFYAFEQSFTLLSRAAVRLIKVPPSEAAWERFPWAAYEVLAPLAAFLLLAGLMWVLYKGRQKEAIFDVPDPHEGLIFLLSRYGVKYDMRGEAAQLGTPETPEGLEETLRKRKNMHAQIFTTTWGPLWAALQHHSGRLQHCWIVCTPGADGTEKLYEVAEQLVHTAVVSPDRPRVACRCVVLPNAYDIAQIKPVIERIYETLPLGLHEDDVIADFTGGTGAMTAGVVLATLSRRRKTQYLLQQKPLLEEQDGKLRYLTPQDIRDQKMLVMIKTVPELVPQQTEEFAARR